MVFVRDIGKGGLGYVQLYKHNSGNLYAVKRMLCAWDANHYQRFIREIKLMMNLAHKNIMRVLKHDAGKQSPYYVMPYYQEGSLRDRLSEMRKKNQVFDSESATSIVFVIADALAYAHKKGAIHRDLKPENILFHGREPIIADWGLGKFIHRESKVLTNATGGLGTPGYCAPEQWNDGNADGRSDIYSLGLIFRELLTGHIHGHVSNPRLKAIIDRMTQSDPNLRYQNMDQVVAAIRGLNVVNEKNPMAAFWKGAAIVGGIALGALIIGGIISALSDDDE